MKLNKKGFTLTELLVVVAILGIITGISIPLIRNLSKTFEKKKYQNYADSVLAAAKIYNDSYSEDLFGHNEHGCAYITYQELVERDLLKDITIDKVSCNSNSTFVRVIKQRDKYSYAGFLGCGKKKNGKAESIDTSLPKENTEYAMDTTYCTGVNQNNLLISADTTWVGNEFNKKRKTTSLTIKSGTGINNNIVIYTAWKLRTTGETTPWVKASFSVKGNQEKELLNGNIISTTSNQLVTPENGDGQYDLIVRVDNLQDLYGSRWRNVSDPSSNTLSFGPFSVDNTPPVITNLKVNSTNANYNSLKVDVDFDANDTHTPQDKLKMCITYDSTKCKNNSEYVAYSKTTEYTISGSYDGSKKTIYIKVKDLAGNKAETTKEYTIATKNTITYDSNGGNACSPTTKSVYYATGTSAKWGELCSPTRNGYTFTGWNTKADGTGTTVTANSVLNGDIKVYAQWRVNVVIIKMNANGATQTGTNTNYTVENGIVKKSDSDIIQTINYGSTLGENGLLDYDNSSGLYLYKAGYTATAWNTKADGTGTSYNKTSQYAASDFCDAKNGNCTVTLYPKWRINVCTINYSPNGGTFTANTTNTSMTCNYGNAQCTSDMRNCDGGYYSATRTGYNIVSGEQWKNGSTTYNQDNAYSTAAFCPNIANGNQSVTLSVNWTPNVCTITFDPNGGTFETNNDARVKTMNYGTTVDNFWNANGGTYSATRTGYHIDAATAWINGSTTYNETAGYTATQVCPNLGNGNQSVTLKANWKANTYTVTLNNNGATTAGTSSATATYGSNKLSTITNPQKKVTITYVNNVGATVSGGDSSKSYTLNGWYTAASGGTKVASNATAPALQANVSGYTNASSQWTKTGNATLYAQWANLTATLPTLSKTGYNCVWITEDNGTKEVASGGTWKFVSANSRTFTAKCTAKTITVTFKPNGGTGSDKTQTFTYGVSNQSFSAKGYTKTGYTQGKWATSSTGTGTYGILSSVADSWINSNAPSITLYATWSKTCPTLTVKKGDGSSYTNSTWTNQNINFTFNFSETNATKYDWLTNTAGGSYTDWGSTNVSTTTKQISGSGKRGIKLKLYDADGSTRECSWSGYWIDKEPPEYVGFSYDGQLVRSDNDDYYNGVVFHFVCADYMSGTATEAVSVKHVNGSGFGTRNGSVVDWTPGIGNYFIEEHCSDVLGNHTQKNWTMDVVSGSGGGNSGSSSSGSNCYLCQCGKTTYTAEGCFNYCSGAVAWYPTNASQSGSSSQGTCFKYCCK